MCLTSNQHDCKCIYLFASNALTHYLESTGSDYVVVLTSEESSFGDSAAAGKRTASTE